MPHEARTILVEFGALTDDQRTCIDLHSLRAVGSDHDELSDSGDFVFEFWLRT